MKIKTAKMKYEDVLAIPVPVHKKPVRQAFVFRLLRRLLSIMDLRATHFTCKRIGMERLGKDEPCLVLMNHSSFIDLEIASTVLFPRQFHIVCTSDGFVGKEWLMRLIGCIPTKKFINDVTLVRDMIYTVKQCLNALVY